MKEMSTSSTEVAIQKQIKSIKRWYVPKRFIVTILSLCGMITAYSMRGNISVVMVAMVNNTCHEVANSSLFNSGSVAGSDVNEAERYNWDAQTQGTILSAFYYSYFVTMLSGGYFCDRFGAKKMFGLGILCATVLNLLTPVSVRWGYVPLIVIRTLLGLSEGLTWPAVMDLMSRWAPKSERSRLYATVVNGSCIGLIISFPVSGWLSSTNFLGGWPSVFYVFGILGCIWCLLWFILVSETPHSHPTITDEELFLFSEQQHEKLDKRKIPWKAFLTSIPLWAAFTSNFGMFFSNNLLIAELPTYLSTVLHFQLIASGFLSTIPYILQVCGAWVAAYIADKLRNSGKLHITTIRKLMDSIGGYGMSSCLIGISLCGYRPHLIIVLFCVGMFINGFKEAGFCVTYPDMSPDFCGVTFGICNGISSVAGIIGPAMAGAFTQDGATVSNWGKVFGVAAAVSISTTMIFSIFASAELQPWGKADFVSQKEEKKDKCLKKCIAL